MTVTTVIKDILAVEEGIIAHQVNLQGVMGAGLAKQIRLKYPEVYQSYSYWCKSGKLTLGSNQYLKVSDGLWICNMAAQKSYGRDKRYTNYDALRLCLRELNATAGSLPVYLPYGIGCGLAGGDWGVVLPMIETVFRDRDVTICKWK